MTESNYHGDPGGDSELDTRLSRVLLNVCTAMGSALTLPNTYPGYTPDLLNEVLKAARSSLLHAQSLSPTTRTIAGVQYRLDKAVGDLGDLIDTINFRRHGELRPRPGAWHRSVDDDGLAS